MCGTKCSCKKVVEVPIGESDLDLFQNLVFSENKKEEEFEWVYDTIDGTEVTIRFVGE